MAAYNSQGYLAPGFDLDYPYQPSPLYSASTASDLTLVGDQQFTPPNYQISDISPQPSKRQKVGGQTKQVKGGARSTIQMPTPDPAADAPEAPSAAAANKPAKRVRTGCLTCRERHLKCDEGLPNCLNCRKSSRECKRGLRLNWLDWHYNIDKTTEPPKRQYTIPPGPDYKGESTLYVLYLNLLTNFCKYNSKTNLEKSHPNIKEVWLAMPSSNDKA